MVWNILCFHVLGIIAPSDELIFFRGVGIPPTSFCLRACGVMFWRARLPHEFLAWAGGLAGTRAALAHSHLSKGAAINFDVLQNCVPVGTVSFPSDSYTLFQGSSSRIKSACADLEFKHVVHMMFSLFPRDFLEAG